MAMQEHKHAREPRELFRRSRSHPNFFDHTAAVRGHARSDAGKHAHYVWPCLTTLLHQCWYPAAWAPEQLHTSTKNHTGNPAGVHKKGGACKGRKRAKGRGCRSEASMQRCTQDKLCVAWATAAECLN
jgi:hypothetical protein